MATVLASWTKLIVDYAVARGHDPAPALAAAGLAGVDLGAPDRRIAADADDRLWRALADQLGDPDLGVHLSESAVTAASLGVVGFLARAAGTIEEAIRAGERFQRLIKDASHIELVASKRGLTVIERPPAQQAPWPRAVAETILANYVTLARAWTGAPIAPLEVWFQHPRPPDCRELERFFGCPIRFGARDNALVFSRATLATPLQTGEPGLAALLEPHARGALDELDAPALADQVGAAIAALLGAGEPSVAAVAARLGASARTLQRHLRAARLSFREILDGVRRRHAVELLRAGVPHAEIAERLSFSDARAFRRAFRRWLGVAPSTVARSVPPVAHRVLRAGRAPAYGRIR